MTKDVLERPKVAAVPCVSTEAIIIGLRISAVSRWPDDIKRQNDWIQEQLNAYLKQYT
jgi:hypothetical protein